MKIVHASDTTNAIVGVRGNSGTVELVDDVVVNVQASLVGFPFICPELLTTPPQLFRVPELVMVPELVRMPEL